MMVHAVNFEGEKPLEVMQSLLTFVQEDDIDTCWSKQLQRPH